VSVAPPPTTGGMPVATAPPAPAPVGDACPLCGAPLHPEQEWCLRCGAAARTRLAASPNWKGLIAALAVVVVLALGVLAAALVKLAGGSGSAGPATTRTVTTAAALAPTPTTTAPSGALPGAAGAGTITPGTTTPGTGKSGAGATGTSKLGTSVSPGAATTTPGVTHGSTTPSVPSAPKAKLSPTAHEEIAREVRERLGKLGLGKALPSTGAK
jgi:hypothetical protein